MIPDQNPEPPALPLLPSTEHLRELVTDRGGAACWVSAQCRRYDREANLRHDFLQCDRTGRSVRGRAQPASPDRRPILLDMEVIVRHQDQGHCASITGMIRHYVARRAKVIEDHPHNAAMRCVGTGVSAGRLDCGDRAEPGRRCHGLLAQALPGLSLGGLCCGVGGGAVAGGHDGAGTIVGNECHRLSADPCGPG